jgi:hypothetical protein
MYISTPKITVASNIATISVTYETSKENNTLWFSVDVKYLKYLSLESVDAFLVGLLFYAMARGEDIHVEGSISEKLFYCLSYYLIPALVIANPKLKKIEIYAKKLEHKPTNIANAVGTGFSGGVDSFCTIYDHLNNIRCPDHHRLTHLTFFNVGSHGDMGGNAARELFKKRCKTLSKYPIECGLDYVVVDSNISEVLQMTFAATHTMRNMAVVLLLQNLFGIYYYSSGYRMDDFRIINAHSDTSAYDILNMAMLSTESVQLYSSGSQYTRVQKTALIADFSPTWSHLNVCVTGEYNCSCCFKCMRTLLTLEILGKIDAYANVFDLKKYASKRERYIAQILVNKKQYIYKDIYNEIILRKSRFTWREKGLAILLHARSFMNNK